MSLTAGLFGAGFHFGTHMAATGQAMRRMPSVLIDPGHGGVDGGCAQASILEKDLNLAAAKALAENLRRYGLDVHLTRGDDRALGATHRRDLLARVEQANILHPDLVISLHADWSRQKQRRGPRVFYHYSSMSSLSLAQDLQAELNRLAHVENSPLPARDLLVIREVKRPAVLIEMGFLSNADEARDLASPQYQRALAEAIGVGVVKYLLAHTVGIALQN